MRKKWGEGVYQSGSAQKTDGTFKLVQLEKDLLRKKWIAKL